jgi:AraC family transcriptional regulator
MTATRTAELRPRFAQGDPMRVIGLAERYDAGTMGRIPEQWERLQTRLGEVRGRSEEAQFGLFYHLGESPFEAEYVTGLMVADDAPLPAGFIERRLPARRHAVFTHRGHVSGLRGLVDAIFREWLPQSAWPPPAVPISSRSTASISTRSGSRGRSRSGCRSRTEGG